MKNILFISSILLLSILSISCNNPIEDIEEPTPIEDGSISFKFDGQNVEFKFAYAGIANVPVTGASLFTITGYNEAHSDFFHILFTTPSNTILNETTYTTIDDACQEETEVCGGLGYGYFESSGNLVPYSTTPGGNCTITFTEIDYKSDGIVQGTFSGELTGENNSKITISDGKFRAKID